MKKISVAVLILVMLLSFAACGKQITLDEAKAIAVNHAKVSMDDVTFTKTEVENKLSGTEFEIEFVCPTGKFEYEIAGNGKIIESTAETSYLPSNIVPEGIMGPSADQILTENDALEIVLKDTGIVKSDIRTQKIHIDTEDGIYVYEVELIVGKDKYEYAIDATTGDIVKSGRSISN